MPKILQIKIYPDPVLRQRAKEIKAADIKKPEIQQLILDLGKTMLAKDGIGLAATQVGLPLRLTVIYTKEGILTLINPRILRKFWKKESGEEGCLSVPNVFGIVKRPTKIKVLAINKEGKKIEFTATGLFARIIQHELDHLDGILFIDKVKEITKGKEELEKLY